MSPADTAAVDAPANTAAVAAPAVTDAVAAPAVTDAVAAPADTAAVAAPADTAAVAAPAVTAAVAAPAVTDAVAATAAADELTPLLLERYANHLRGQRGLSENTARIYQEDLNPFRRYLEQSGDSPRQMNRRMARSYLAWLATEGRETIHPYSGRKQREGYARVSILRQLTALRSFYQFLAQEGWFRHNPVPSGRSMPVKTEKPLPSFVGQQEAVRLLENPDTDNDYGQRDRAILEVLYSCGVRLAEIVGMDLPDLRLAQRRILVTGKGNKERWVLFGPPAAAALQSYLDESRPALLNAGLAAGRRVERSALFLNRYGQRLSRRSIEKLVKSHAAQAGLRDGIHPHTLRHSFASHMLEGAADLRVIQELLGHSSPTTTQIYTHITKQEAKAAYRNFHPRAGNDGEEGE